MSNVGQIVYDKDAVYINLNNPQYTTSGGQGSGSATAPPRDGRAGGSDEDEDAANTKPKSEGVGLVQSLQVNTCVGCWCTKASMRMSRMNACLSVCICVYAGKCVVEQRSACVLCFVFPFRMWIWGWMTG
jgi:hypothetical protein